jgi:hypothetical protein
MAETVILPKTVVPPTEFEVQVGVPDIRDRMAELLRQPKLTRRQVYYNLQRGFWPGIHRGGLWELRPARVLEEMRREEDAALAARRGRLAAQKGNGEQHEAPPPSPPPPLKKRPRGRPFPRKAEVPHG